MKLPRTAIYIAILAIATSLTIIGCSNKNPGTESQPETVKARPVVPDAKPPPALPINPLAGVGAVRKGMSEVQVETELGRPDLIKSTIWMYQHLGVWVLFDNDGIVLNIHCRKPFAGRTREGIGVGSTRAEVIKAFGNPNQVNLAGKGRENLWFDANAISMILEHDQIMDLVVHLESK